MAVRLRHLVVVVPGIGGSVLTAPGSPAAAGVDSANGVHYGLSPRGLVRAGVTTGLLDRDRYPELVPTGLVNDLAVLPPVWVFPGYQRLRLHLHNAFPDPPLVIETYRPETRRTVDPRTDVLFLPYDFRRSIVDSTQRLDAAVSDALRHSDGRRPDRPVIVVAHSLGGLVARYWLAVGGGSQVCQALMTLGTPYRGAPKALDWLINGAGVTGLRHRGLTGVLRGWPSVYELLPQYDAVWDAAANAPFELTELPESLLQSRPRLRGYVDRFTAMAAAGRMVHERLRDGWAALLAAGRAPQSVLFLGRGHATPSLATLKDGRLRVVKQDPAWRGNVGWGGDGTVPTLSAIPTELGERPDLWRVLAGRHGPLGSVADPVQVLRSYAGDPVPVRGGPLPDHAWLGLDLDEFAEAGAPVPVGVRLLPDPIEGEACWVSVAAVEGTPARPWRGQLRSDPGSSRSSWRGVIGPQPPGRYVVTVEVTGTPGSVTATDTLVVLEPEDGWTDSDIDDVDDMTGGDGGGG